MKLKTIVADDEPLARERLRFLLSADEDFAIAAECRTGKQVVDALKAERFDVLFLDIQMPGGGGFEIIEQVGAANMPVTVFVTAHNHYAVQAFEVHALDYLTKPVEPERLKATLVRVKERMAFEAARLTQEQMQLALRALRDENEERREYPTRLVVPNGTRDAFVNIDEIEWVEAADYYACLHVGARSLMLRETIKQLAETLDPRKFVRVHRSAIVNIAHVREILREGRNEGWVFLSNGQRVKMSKAGWQNLLSVSRS
ncbi:LytR/AlgR family response regulator transcription factor [Terracidiphilus gabretensis]|uniref:LytR/AlgR family response regulator transcription factor n=1 Tax=Terracidiphilus gabretensis TaxID=1577687 RepID=UPI00071B9EEA|nr:LytTR family DNA-binding domain-containing protein [Terracidiphilus gabretensis]